MLDNTRKTKVLIIDDSAVTRYLLTEIIDQSEDMEVIGTVQDPTSAMGKVLTLNPDVILLDIMATGTDELFFLEKLMKNCPVPVVIITAMTSCGSSAALRATEIGAFGYIYKNSHHTWSGILNIADEIIQKIRSAATAKINGAFNIKTYEPSTTVSFMQSN